MDAVRSAPARAHLLENLRHPARQRPDWRVLYVTTEDFASQFVQAMRLGKLGVRKQFRDCDALLVDDLHFLATRRAGRVPAPSTRLRGWPAARAGTDYVAR